MCQGGASLTFQAEDPLSQGVHDVLERGLVGDVEEVFVIGVAGDELDLVQKGLGVDPSPVVVAQDLLGSKRPEFRGIGIPGWVWGWEGSQSPCHGQR